MRLVSVSSDACLEFSDVEGDHFRVTLTAHDHSASRRVCAYTDRAGVARLFADAAREWKGWDGVKSWESLEGELRIELTIDRCGHVTVATRIGRDTGDSDTWQLDAELRLEAGQLERVATEAGRLWGGGD